ncbi:4-hydroxyphenylpyruvate dioxygenase/hemolysin-like protein [Frankia casuarinae]|uniref:4-hydroxyphenylpyruvate dioxygenase n=1 Tax=Frankia casuarinae (strain DSM 45818 / CECT 9043 / HFP020203 / CcI3) TaxID=106370 RepID=Q2JA71_FRACC|nr:MULTISPECIES: 4-hydroxyphenylpyruvate dioxygenase [Frankia]ABD11821.1 4-hydroxyphenylpyruvate dioxygenase [Frankia casuarinae]ESZ99818.1 4-hydroxyphenylpyruvate dioxygenase/hemolysin-like protein [Frankia sp. CcI6]EYT89788.1 4-hydroxyphenylpyruvate dioxygenase/hemolysin-like protein [Frankia casuarinae]KDA40693.1 4-hydroxyphenylpyruvate dioxygenase/hemolysin-like protein [Frankia sp. BMG5.23]OAA26546.1 4-hydroxyphenylpyruvate dioxygenase [Frankia casuarinae]
MDIHSIDHIELFVEDAAQAAAELCDSFGFTVTGRGGPRTGLKGCESVLLRQCDITVVVTAATSSDHRAAEFVRRHGDGVAVIGFAVDQAQAAFAEAVNRGAVPVTPPETLGTPGGRVTFASVAGFGDVEHRFTSREAVEGPFSPGLIEETVPDRSNEGLLRAIDHVAVCLPAGELHPTVRAYRDVFGFTRTFEERIVVGSQAMDSQVVRSPSGKVTFTIIEPDTTRAPGQIDEFVRSHGGAGIQHIAFRTDDITAAVRDSAKRGVRFLTTPASYYEALPARLGPVGVPVETLRELNILADRDHGGVMLQIFTASRHPRRTFFHELIDRRGAHTFGSNNIKALYEAVERQRAAESA